MRRRRGAAFRAGFLLGALLLAGGLLETGLRLGARLYSRGNDARVAALREKSGAIILCLGESTTEWGGKDSYPSQLEARLNEGRPGAYAVVNLGVTGTTTENILDRLEEDLDFYRPAAVVAMMGINDDERLPAGAALSGGDPFPALAGLRLYRVARLALRNARQGLVRRGLLEENLRARARPADLPPGARPRRAPPPSDPRSEELQRLAGRREAEGRWEEAESLYREAVAADPRNALAQEGLARARIRRGDGAGAEDAFRRGLEADPDNPTILESLASYHENRGDDAAAARFYARAIEADPWNTSPYIRLGWLYRRQGRLREAEAAFRRPAELFPEADKYLGALASLHLARGDREAAEGYFRRTEAARAANEENPLHPVRVTRRNFLRLRDALRRRGVPFVCMQYPLRPLARLERWLGGGAGVVFVDNERPFRAALETRRYEDLFTDMFAGDFGHCTPLGNRLLAESAADGVRRALGEK